jgi:tetratricopeptide (TPR) repeat protein
LSGLSEPKAAIDEGRKTVAAYQATRPVDIPGLSESRIWLAHDLSRTGEFQEATALLQRVEHDMPELEHQNPELRVRLLQTRSILGADQMDIRGGYEYGREAWLLLQTLPQASDTLRDTLEFDMADSQIMLSQLTGAEATLRNLIARQTLRLGAGHEETLFSKVLLANDLVLARRLDEVESLIIPAIDGISIALGPTARRTLLAQSVLANLRMQQHRYPEAGALYTRLHTAMVEQNGENNQAALSFLENVAAATHLAGDLPAAERLYRNALAGVRTLFEEDNPQVQHVRYGLATLLLDRQRAQEAASLLATLEIAGLNLAEQEADWEGRLAYEHGRVLLQTGHPKDALPLLQKAGEIVTARFPDDVNVPLPALRTQIAALRLQANAHPLPETATSAAP